MTRQAVTPADLLGRIDTLNVVCSKCERRGRYRVQTIVRERGSTDASPTGSLAFRRTARGARPCNSATGVASTLRTWPAGNGQRGVDSRPAR